MKFNKTDFTDGLRNFVEVDNYYRHCLPSGLSINLTEGCHFVRETAGEGAQWLFDLVLSWQPSLTDSKFQVWNLARQTNDTWNITCRDANGSVLASRHILHTDFPIDSFEFWVEDDVALLPHESQYYSMKAVSNWV